jgi:hypothetical protein
MIRRIALLSGPVLLASATLALATSPWSGGGGGVDNAAKPKPTCETFLDNNSYDCSVKSSFGSSFTDCFTFASPGTVSSNFDLTVKGLSSTHLGCSCTPTGSFKKPKFDTGKGFDCTNVVSGGPIDFQGKVTGKGKKLVQGQVYERNGSSFVYQCTLRATSCGSPSGAFIDGMPNF